jgi:hypothetical protein
MAEKVKVSTDSAMTGLLHACKALVSKGVSSEEALEAIRDRATDVLGMSDEEAEHMCSEIVGPLVRRSMFHRVK